MSLPVTAAICSFRLGGADGVAIEASKWAGALVELGLSLRTVAGEGDADVTVPGLAIGASTPPSRDELSAALAGCELVIVENLCSLPLNPGARAQLLEVLRGRPALFHHHDLALERPEYAHFGPPADDPAWIHVCISEAAVARLASHAIPAHLLRNTFLTDPVVPDRLAARRALGIGERERLVLQPTRAIARKNIPAGLELARALAATYWLTGPAEDGYDGELARLLDAAQAPVVHRGLLDLELGYAAADLVALPSLIEGFGNPAVEAAIRGRPVAVGPYANAHELAELGFRFLDATDPPAVAAALDDPLGRAEDERENRAAARHHLDLVDLPGRLRAVLETGRGA